LEPAPSCIEVRDANCSAIPSPDGILESGKLLKYAREEDLTWTYVICMGARLVCDTLNHQGLNPFKIAYNPSWLELGWLAPLTISTFN